MNAQTTTETNTAVQLSTSTDGLQVQDWLDRALTATASADAMEVAGAQIAYRVWDDPAASSTVMLVHGGAAHSHWWDSVAPLLSTRSRVVALDLSGHGISDWRESYDLATWGSEVLAVSSETAVGPVTLVGHSLGGLVATRLATQTGDLAAAIAVDSPIGTDMVIGSDEIRSPDRPRIYPTLEAGSARFRPVPIQASDPRIAHHIAALSLREVDDGWTWKFDQRVFDSAPYFAIPEGLTIPYGYVRAENGLMRAEVRDIVVRGGGDYVELPEAGHAPMLDQPLVLAAVIRALRSAWAVEEPERPRDQDVSDKE
jgi:pimeloyl-ACP methyl ester carboxylesterase